MRDATKILSLLVVCALFTTIASGEKSVRYKPETPYRIKTVVIDAGHGGHDHGCSGKSSKEKNVALKIALELGDRMKAAYPDINIVYTRRTDVFIELHERAAIANRHNADLFICIHCNANPSSQPYGTETYVMGLHKTEANLSVAKRENEVVLLEDNYTDHYDGFNPNDPSAHIIFSLFQHAYMAQSISFASKCENEFATQAKRKSRGVKQAGFLVLWKTSMPAVLIETGFLTNGNEESFLNSTTGQNKMAQCILDAFTSYKQELETESVPPGLIVNSTTEIFPIGVPDVKAEVIPEEGVHFMVQILASKSLYDKEPGPLAGSGSQTIYYAQENGWYKYRSAAVDNFEAASALQSSFKQAGYTDAFLVAFKDGERIKIEEARSLTIR